MIPLFVFLPQRGRNIDLSDGIEFLHYAKKPKKRSISGFLLLSIPLGLIVFVVCQAITVHTCSIDLANKILDWEQTYFWATMLILFGMGLITNSIGWTIFMIKKRHPKHTGIT